MPTVRVLVANLSGLVAEVLASLIQEEQDMVLVGQVQGQIDTLAAAGQADVLILGAPKPAPLPPICSHLLSEYPDLRIMVMDPTGKVAMLYWRGLRQQPLNTESMSAIVTNIRQSYRLNPTV